MKYFKNFPLVTYWFSDRERMFYAINYFIKFKILEHLTESPALMINYVMNTAERPDIVAYNLYKESDLHWTILLANELMDPNDWIMDDRTFDTYIRERYDNKDAIAYTEKDGIEADLRAHQKLINDKPFGTNIDSYVSNFADPLTFVPITFAKMEDDMNEQKRIIRVIRPEKMVQFLKEVEERLRGIS